MYILVEGPDAVGKGTLIDKLEKHLEFPGNPPVSRVSCYFDPGISHDPEFNDWQALRAFVKNHEMDAMAEMLMFYTLRARLMVEVDKDLSNGIDVIQDRGSISTMVYQGVLKGCPVRALDNLCDFTKPDITLVLDAPFKVLSARLEKRADNMDKFKSDKKFRKKVHQCYREIINTPGVKKAYNIVTINADQGALDVLADCITAIDQRRKTL